MGFGIASVLLIACGDSERQGTQPVRVESPWARVAPLLPSPEGAGPTGTNSAIYMILINDGDSGDRLTGARSPAARAVELHESRMEDGVMTMRQLDGVEIPPGQTVTFRPAGRHLMLLDLAGGLREGDTVDLTLELERSGPLEVRVPVRRSGEG
jgi:copper(I)-binding protein